MPDPRQLPWLLRLLDDDSPEVRSAVLDQFASFGEELENHLSRLDLPRTAREMGLIESLLREGRRRRLRSGWEALATVQGDKPLLEAGQDCVSRFLRRDRDGRTLTEELDALAEAFGAGAREQDALALGSFLFRTRGLTGDRETYEDPSGSDLHHVITSGKGLPISLASIYILVAYRLGLRVEGCNLPGHFLALAGHGGRTFVVDCFNDGAVLLDADLARLSAHAPVRTVDLAALQCDARVILARVMRNLSAALRRRSDEQSLEDAALVESLSI